MIVTHVVGNRYPKVSHLKIHGSVLGIAYSCCNPLSWDCPKFPVLMRFLLKIEIFFMGVMCTSLCTCSHTKH